MSLALSLTRYRRLIMLVMIIALVLIAVEMTGLREQLSVSFLRENLEANPVTGMVIFVLVFVVGNLIQLPGWIFLVAAILALGTVMGGVVTYIAAVTSCLVTFALVRGLGGNALREIKSPLAQKILARLDTHPVRSVTVMRMLFQTMPALNYTLALSGVPLRPYVIGTLLGLPFPITLYCLFFDRILLLLPIG
ncbi:TVP38/TMEM64 family protein [Alcanivorax sp. DP30]|uniref:TVP38/TMEM64 family protein n=1 Tax=Alcanivorax sp. DP30 TaxID=2606217 RepID=UPI00351B2D8B